MSPEDRRIGAANLWMILVVLGIVAWLSAGCAMFRKAPSGAPAGANVPSGPSPGGAPTIWTHEQVQVLKAAIEKDRVTLASVLESVPDNGLGIMLDYEVHERLPDGLIATGPNGQPLVGKCRAVLKANNIQNLQALNEVGRVEYTLLGRPNINENSAERWTIPLVEGLRLNASNVRGVAIEGQLAQIVAARAAERAAVIEGWSALIEAEWGGRIKWVGALGDATAVVATSAGEQAVKVLKVVTPEGAAIEGLRLLVERPDGKQETVTVDQ